MSWISRARWISQPMRRKIAEAWPPGNVATASSSPFSQDDFPEIYEKYFKDIVESGAITMDPSGWRDTDAGLKIVPTTTSAASFVAARYHVDHGNNLGQSKTGIGSLLECWDRRKYRHDSFSIFSSVTTASLGTLFALKNMGVTHIVADTPLYFGSIYQMNLLGFNVTLLPTYADSGYLSGIQNHVKTARSPTVFWISQPKFGLGIDQNLSIVEQLIDLIPQGCWLVIDEAMEMRFPSWLSQSERFVADAPVIRLRGFFKPLGLNGFRIAAALHPPALRSHYESLQWAVTGGLDGFSLAVLNEFAQSPAQFKGMLDHCREKILTRREIIESFLSGSSLKLNPIVNGYIGSMRIPWGTRPEKHVQMRDSLLSFCQAIKMPVMLGASMLFAFEEGTEIVRLNFLSEPHHIENFAKVMAERYNFK